MEQQFRSIDKKDSEENCVFFYAVCWQTECLFSRLITILHSVCVHIEANIFIDNKLLLTMWRREAPQEASTVIQLVWLVFAISNGKANGKQEKIAFFSFQVEK